MTTFTGKFTPYFMLGLTGILGGGPLLIFMLFLFIGPLKLMDLGLSEGAALGLNACLCLVFFI